MHRSASQSKILLFLPDGAARMVSTKLAECGLITMAVSTVPQVFDALRSEEFAFAITTRADIDLVRNIRAIPVMNIEVFFHSSEAGGDRSKRFDSKAFLARVEFLCTRAPVRPEASVAGRAPGPSRETRSWPWWSIAVNALRLTREQKGSLDIQS
jgi:hypothetical protein